MKSVDALRNWADGLRGIWLDPNDHSIIVTTCDDMPPSMDCVSLREYVNGIFDEIEREVGDNERFRAEAEPFCNRLREAVAERADVTLFGVDYTPLPVDADGEPIHVGDVVAATLAHGGSGQWIVDRMELTRAYDQDLWQIALDKDGACWVTPSTVRHHHAPTVEDVLREFAAEVETAGGVVELPDATFAEYAARLRLAGEDA